MIQCKNKRSEFKSKPLLGALVACALASAVHAGLAERDTAALPVELQDSSIGGGLDNSGSRLDGHSMMDQITPITIYNADGFAPLPSGQPHNAFGFPGSKGKYDQGDGFVSHPFQGWADFALIGNQNVTVQWNFTSVSPDQYQHWSIASLSNPAHVLAGMQWSNDQGTSLGVIEIVPAAVGSAAVALSQLGGAQQYRMSFSGLSLGMSDSAMQGVAFISSAVPSPGPVALLVIAGLISKRRRG
jgi:hypothetical protein